MLINESQIISNLRRTAEKGLISLINSKQLEELALKYFGIYEGDELVGYMCPYSGEVYNDFNEIVLEHIIPVASNGGTVLFNCIPTSKKVNGVDEKGAKHLIEWWTNSKYWNDTAPERLESIVNYMLDAYSQVFEKYTEKEIEESFLEVLENVHYSYEEDDLTENPRDSYKEELLQASNNKIYSYLGFLNDCIEKLNELGIDTTIIRENLQELEQKDIFREIDKFTQIQNITKQVIKETLGDDNKTYLTYSLNIDIKRLLDSINYTTEEDIYNEISYRLKNIESMLIENNKSIIDFYQSLKEIEDINIFYKNINEISIEEKNTFIENLKLSTDSKINIFIEMLNQGNSRILKQRNKESLDGYPDVKLSYFWDSHKEKVIQKLFVELKDNPNYASARNLIEINEVTNNLDKKIQIFIEMLNQGNIEILKSRNEEILEGYPNIKVSNFWSKYKAKIEKFLFVELKDSPNYDMARQTIFKYFEVNSIEEYNEKKKIIQERIKLLQERINVEDQITIFINMLNKGNTKILKQRNKETLDEYPDIKLSNFWNRNKERIMQKLFIELKDNPNYEIARNLIEFNEMKNNLDKKIQIFIDMLNKGNIKILNKNNTETLEGYPNINLSQFWSSHKEKIEKLLFVELKDNPIYDMARQTIFKYFEVNSIEEYNERKKKIQERISTKEQILIFIDMLNQGNTEILKQRNTEVLEGYPDIKLSHFWNVYKDKIENLLFGELKDNPIYDMARRTIFNYYEVTNIEEYNERKKKIQERISIEEQISIFINMLNKGNNNILKSGNKETLDGYSDIKLSDFWHRNKHKIEELLFEELRDNSNYAPARNLIKIYEVTVNIDKQIPIFIEMLNKGNTKILKQGNNETLDGYPDIKLFRFWKIYKERVIQKLFIELKDDNTYNTAIQVILDKYKVSTIEEYYDKEVKKKALREVKKGKKEAELLRDSLELEESNNRKRA